MAGYDGGKLSNIVTTLEGQGPSLWSYITADSLATVMGAGYMSDAKTRRMKIGDLVLVAIGTFATAVYTAPTTAAVGSTSDFSAVPTYVWLQVVSFTTNAANLAGMQETIGGAATDKIGFYGATPIVQRSGAAEHTSLLSTASSTAIDTATKAAIIEIMNTLTALGLWAG